MKRWFYFLVSLPFWLSAQQEDSSEVKSPQQVQGELDQAQAQFERAKKLFNPWYTGPLITPSATMMPPGVINYQPYAYAVTNYAQFDEDRNSISIPTQEQFLVQNIFQTGIASWMDTLLFVQGQESWQSHKNGGGFGDITWGFGWPLFLQTLYVPQFKITIQETFPVGRYKRLSPTLLGMDGVGAGSYKTQFALIMSKVLFWATQHPVNTRLFLGYTIPTTVHVAGYNTYGGGVGTIGKVRPGNAFSADLGIEYSISQPWVVALDIVYTAVNRTTFHGHPGVTAAGLPAVVGSGSNDNLSLAPGFEYNWNSNLGIVFGGWFSVYGRNSDNFATGIFSVTWTFEPTTQF